MNSQIVLIAAAEEAHRQLAAVERACGGAANMQRIIDEVDAVQDDLDAAVTAHRAELDAGEAAMRQAPTAAALSAAYVDPMREAMAVHSAQQAEMLALMSAPRNVDPIREMLDEQRERQREIDERISMSTYVDPMQEILEWQRERQREIDELMFASTRVDPVREVMAERRERNRTIHELTHAAILHDYLYKTSVVTPEQIAASATRALAVNKNADQNKFWQKSLRVLRNAFVHGRAVDEPSVLVPDFVSTSPVVTIAEAKSNGVVTAGSMARRIESLRNAIVTDVHPITGASLATEHAAMTMLTEVTAFELLTVEEFFSTASDLAQLSLYELAVREQLLEATEFHVLRQRDGNVVILPLVEREPGEDSQLVVTFPIAANAPNIHARVRHETGGAMAA